jgi:hypothetical protein
MSGHCTSTELVETVSKAILADHIHVVLVGRTDECKEVLVALQGPLGKSLPLACGPQEVLALAQARTWLRTMRLQATPESGWCTSPEVGQTRCLAFLDLRLLATPTRSPLDPIRETLALLGPATQLIVALDEQAPDALKREVLLLLGHQVIEVQLGTVQTPRPAQPNAARLEAGLVFLILLLVGLSTLWLTDQAVSEPIQDPHQPIPMWKVRP